MLKTPLTIPSPRTWEIVIVGAGAAGLATAIFTRTQNPRRSVLLLDTARKPGAKILVSGGSRCNVTNTIVTERDYWGGPSTIVRRILRAFPASEAAAFFERAGVTLHEEEDGKLFPDSNSSRDVLDALLRKVDETGVVLRSSHRVTEVTKANDAFIVRADGREIAAQSVVLATGGQSLPKTGSDGGGYVIARTLGHTIVPTTPALAPLILNAAENGSLHTEISGVSLDVVVTLWVDGAVATRLRGSLLWTHFGISGPVALNLSRHWLRAKLEGRAVAATASFAPDLTFPAAEQLWLEECRARPRSSVASALRRLVTRPRGRPAAAGGPSCGSYLPDSMAAALLLRLSIDPSVQLANLGREDRRRLTHALVEWPLQIADSRGYSYAEATAGGVDLREIDPATMESRVWPRLYLVGEILDVDGRLGGFNFQWAWSTAFVAASAMAGRAAIRKGRQSTSTGERRQQA